MNGGAGHAGFVARADRAGIVDRSGAGNTSACSHLSVASISSLLLAAPKWSTSGARSVVVARAWTEALFFAVMTGKENLNDGGEEEEEDGAD